MANFFLRLFNAMERSNRRQLIASSGSERTGGNEKVRAGQSYLYRKDGMESEVFEVRFHENVRGGELNRALSEALKRYPYLNTRLVELDGDFYIVQDPVSMTARRSEKLPSLGGIADGYHLVDVTYFGKSVYLSFHHALCDGRGIKPFLETLLFYYCAYRYQSKEPGEGIRRSDQPLLEGETAEPFESAYSYDASKTFPAFSREAFALPDKDEGDTRFELVMPRDRFLSACKGSGATPAIFLARCMSKGIAGLYPDFEKPIHANIAADMRAALDVPNTYKNCVRTLVLPYDRQFAAKPATEQAEEYRALLNAQRDRDCCRKAANEMLSLFEKLDSLPSYEQKQAMMSFFEGMKLDTYVISYVGDVVLGENARHIEGIHLYNSGALGLGLNAVCCGDKFILDFKQSFSSASYVKAFETQLDAYGIPHRTSGAIGFSTPADSLMRRNTPQGASI